MKLGTNASRKTVTIQHAALAELHPEHASTAGLDFGHELAASLIHEPPTLTPLSHSLMLVRPQPSQAVTTHRRHSRSPRG